MEMRRTPEKRYRRFEEEGIIFSLQSLEPRTVYSIA
jgi:hypothetical protein